MAKTQAERARAYRQKERDENVTVKRDVTECDAPSVTTFDTGDVYPTTAEDRNAQRNENVTDGKPVIQHDNSACSGSAKPTFADLPSDVQASIEHMCSENNNGQRAGSHSRAAMTERALHYQAMFGKRTA